MGKKLEKIFEVVTEKAGLDARMKLASKTGITKRQAAEAADTPDLVEKLKTVASDLIRNDIEKFL